MSGDGDDRNIRGQVMNHSHGLYPFAMFHDHIGDDHVMGVSFEGIEPFVSTGGFGHPIPRVLQALANLMAKPWIVIDKENRNHIRHCKKRSAKIYKN